MFSCRPAMRLRILLFLFVKVLITSANARPPLEGLIKEGSSFEDGKFEFNHNVLQSLLQGIFPGKNVRASTSGARVIAGENKQVQGIPTQPLNQQNGPDIYQQPPQNYQQDPLNISEQQNPAEIEDAESGQRQTPNGFQPDQVQQYQAVKWQQYQQARQQHILQQQQQIQQQLEQQQLLRKQQIQQQILQQQKLQQELLQKQQVQQQQIQQQEEQQQILQQQKLQQEQLQKQQVQQQQFQQQLIQQQAEQQRILQQQKLQQDLLQKQQSQQKLQQQQIQAQQQAEQQHELKEELLQKQLLQKQLLQKQQIHQLQIQQQILQQQKLQHELLQKQLLQKQAQQKLQQQQLQQQQRLQPNPILNQNQPIGYQRPETSDPQRPEHFQIVQEKSEDEQVQQSYVPRFLTSFSQAEEEGLSSQQNLQHIRRFARDTRADRFPSFFPWEKKDKNVKQKSPVGTTRKVAHPSSFSSPAA